MWKLLNAHRGLALALCAALTMAIVPASMVMQSNTMAGPALNSQQTQVVTESKAQPQAEKDKAAKEQAKEIYGAQTEVYDATSGFWSKFHFLNYMYSPDEKVVYNQQKAFQKIFGFNKAYDMFAWTMNVYADTLRFQFTYGGKDWMIQLWKGSYAIFLSTGGEIGVYTKPSTRKTGHYDCAKEPDWLNMEMSLYNNGRYLFTRPYGLYWWCTGYHLSYLNGWARKPRTDCVMEARLELKDSAMAKIFAGLLAEKGFKKADKLAGPKTPDAYTISGKTVRWVWQYVMDAVI